MGCHRCYVLFCWCKNGIESVKRYNNLTHSLTRPPLSSQVQTVPCRTFTHTDLPRAIIIPPNPDASSTYRKTNRHLVHHHHHNHDDDDHHRHHFLLPLPFKFPHSLRCNGSSGQVHPLARLLTLLSCKFTFGIQSSRGKCFRLVIAVGPPTSAFQ